MNCQQKRVLRASIGLALLALHLASNSAAAASIAAGTQTISGSVALEEMLPAVRSFSVATSGDLEIRLVDLASPAPLAQLRLLLTRGATTVARLDAAGTAQVSATPGTYTLQVQGHAATQSAGSFRVQVLAAPGGAELLQFSDGLSAPVTADPARSALNTTLNFTSAGTYTLRLTDRAFPDPLASVALLLRRQDGSSQISMSSAGTSAPFAVSSPGAYDLLVVARANAANRAGLYSLIIEGGSPHTAVYANTLPVGLLSPPLSATIPASGSYTLTVSDFGVPDLLQVLQVQVSAGERELLPPMAAGSTALQLNAGAVQIFRFARGSAGSYGLSLAQGALTLVEDARAVPEGFDSASGRAGYRFALDVPASSSYRVQLRDFAFPMAFTDLRAVISQNGSALQALLGSGSALQSLNSGQATVLVMAQAAGSAGSANSLFGMVVESQPAGAVLLSATQGVGSLFHSRNLQLPAAGSYDFSLGDLAFPSAFGELAAMLTQGTTSSGQIFGTGRLTFNGSAGANTLNILGRLNAGADYGTFSYDLAATPPVPVLSLSANASAVSTQQSIVLQWSATDATSCTASGAWLGSRPANGSETVGPFSASDRTFNLQCGGPGGSATRSVTIAVSEPATVSGGGGSLSAFWLLALLMLGLGRLAYAPARAFSR